MINRKLDKKIYRIIQDNNLNLSLFPEYVNSYLQNINKCFDGLNFVEEFFKDDSFLLKIRDYKIENGFGIASSIPEMKRFMLELCQRGGSSSGGSTVEITKNYLRMTFYGENHMYPKPEHIIYKKEINIREIRNKKLSRINE